jgi:hypothetical protein
MDSLERYSLLHILSLCLSPSLSRASHSSSSFSFFHSPTTRIHRSQPHQTGQQSRVDCVKLAGRKVETFYLRQHPKVLALHFKPSVKRQERINARVRYIEGDFTAPELAHWMENFVDAPEPLSSEEKAAFVATLSGVALSSDAFFPFRDNIDQVRVPI